MRLAFSPLAYLTFPRLKVVVPPENHVKHSAIMPAVHAKLKGILHLERRDVAKLRPGYKAEISKCDWFVILNEECFSSAAKMCAWAIFLTSVTSHKNRGSRLRRSLRGCADYCVQPLLNESRSRQTRDSETRGSKDRTRLLRSSRSVTASRGYCYLFNLIIEM
jgi:hypothetical protein